MGVAKTSFGSSEKESQSIPIIYTYLGRYI
jgi:hypothetical protein